MDDHNTVCMEMVSRVTQGIQVHRSFCSFFIVTVRMNMPRVVSHLGRRKAVNATGFYNIDNNKKVFLSTKSAF